MSDRGSREAPLVRTATSAEPLTNNNARLFSARALKGVLLFGDMLVVTVSVLLATWVLAGEGLDVGLSLGRTVAVLSALAVGSYLVEGYDPQMYRNRAGVVTRMILGVTFAGCVLAVFVLLVPQLHLDRGTSATIFLFLTPMLLLWRAIGAQWLRKHLPRKRVAVVGSGQAAADLIEAFSDDETYGLGAIIATSDSSKELLVSLEGQKVFQQKLSDLPKLLIRQRISLVAVAIPEAHRQELFGELVACRYAGIEVQDMASCFELLTKRLPVRYLQDDWVAFSSRFLGWGHDWERNLKRLIDISLSMLILVVALPFMAFLAALIRLTSQGSALFRQERVGISGKTFTLFKFRSMRLDAEKDGAVWAKEDDPRVTWLGKVLRRTHLDELPQLFNVIRGDMSLVGPRPERPEFVDELRRVVPYYDLRHVIKPGVTGWAQVRYPYGASVEDAYTKLEYDLYYVRNRSILWDMRIILRTLTVALLGRGSR